MATTRNEHVRNLYRNGASMTNICRTFNLTQSEVEKICDAITVVTIGTPPIIPTGSQRIPPNIVRWSGAPPTGVRGDKLKWED